MGRHERVHQEGYRCYDVFRSYHIIASTGDEWCMSVSQQGRRLPVCTHVGKCKCPWLYLSASLIWAIVDEATLTLWLSDSLTLWLSDSLAIWTNVDSSFVNAPSHHAPGSHVRLHITSLFPSDSRVTSLEIANVFPWAQWACSTPSHLPPRLHPPMISMVVVKQQYISSAYAVVFPQTPVLHAFLQGCFYVPNFTTPEADLLSICSQSLPTNPTPRPDIYSMPHCSVRTDRIYELCIRCIHCTSADCSLHSSKLEVPAWSISAPNPHVNTTTSTWRIRLDLEICSYDIRYQDKNNDRTDVWCCTIGQDLNFARSFAAV